MLVSIMSHNLCYRPAEMKKTVEVRGALAQHDLLISFWVNYKT